MTTKSLGPLEYFNEGNTWTDVTAREPMPILLASAEAGRVITYKQLSHKLHEVYGHPIPKSFRNYGEPPGKIGYSLEKLSDVWGEPIPPLSAFVINGTSQLPGRGAKEFIDRYLSKFAANSKPEGGLQGILDDIASYPKWNKVANFFGITFENHHHIKDEAPPIKAPALREFHGGPESEDHKALKLWVKEHPEIVEKEFGRFTEGDNEKLIRSGDRLDVYFRNALTELAVEVKASNVPPSEYFRGIYQCVKYRAVLRASQLADNKVENAQAALVYQRGLPPEALRLALRLQVVVIKSPKF